MEYGVSEIKLGSYAIFYARLVNSLTGIMFDNQMIKMEGDDYQGWNDDIPYVENFILGKLGLEKQVTE